MICQIIIRTNAAVWRKYQIAEHHTHTHRWQWLWACWQWMNGVFARWLKGWILSEMTHPLLRPLPGESHEWGSDWSSSWASLLPSSGHQYPDMEGFILPSAKIFLDTSQIIFHACMEYVGFALMLYKMKCFFGGLKSRGWRLVKEQISHFDTVVFYYLLILYWCSQCFSFSLHRDRAEPVVLNNHGRCTLKMTTRQGKCSPLAAAARSKQLEQLFTSIAQTSGSTLINIFSRISQAS